MAPRTVEQAMNQAREHLLRLPNVTGVGIGEKNGEQVIVVFVTHKLPLAQLEPSAIVPKHIDRFKTDVRPEVKVGSIGNQIL